MADALNDSERPAGSSQSDPPSRYQWVRTGDINAFFGLMLDNVAGLILMVSLLTGFGFPADFAPDHTTNEGPL